MNKTGVPLWRLALAAVTSTVAESSLRATVALMGHNPTDGRLDYCWCGASWPCPQADPERRDR